MSNVLERLAIGDRRTIGAADAVADEIKDDPPLFDQVFSGLYSNEPGLRMRAADALEKASAENPSLLVHHTTALLNGIGECPQQEVQWHIAQMLPRCELTSAQKEMAVDLMRHYLDTSKSNIVHVFALRAINELAGQDIRFISTAKAYLQRALHSQAPSLRSCARRIVTHDRL